MQSSINVEQSIDVVNDSSDECRGVNVVKRLSKQPER